MVFIEVKLGKYNMFKKVLIIGSLAIAAISVFFSVSESAVANNSLGASNTTATELTPSLLNVELLKTKIKAKLGLTVEKVEATPVPGIALLITNQGLSDYNDRGITFRYLAYPRSGIKDQAGNYTQGFKDLRSVWCADDPKEAMTNAKNSRAVAYRVCNKPIKGEFDFGRQVGVNGTPAIVLSNGMMVPGYQPPEQLEQLLKNL